MKLSSDDQDLDLPLLVEVELEEKGKEEITENQQIQEDLEFFDSFRSFEDEDEDENEANRKKNGTWNCGYVNAVFASVEYSLNYHSNLFTDDELELLRLLQTKLSLNSKRILSRLLFRKHKWMKTSSFIYYLKSKPNYLPEEKGELQKSLLEALDELHDYQIIQKISSDLTFEESWQIANQLFTYMDWLMLYKFLFSISASKSMISNSNTNGTSTSHQTKQDFIMMMKKMIVNRKTVFGGNLSIKFPLLFLKFLQTVWLQKNHHNHSHDNNNNTTTSTTTTSAPTITTSGPNVLQASYALIQMNLHSFHFMKRILRLYQVSVLLLLLQLRWRQKFSSIFLLLIYIQVTSNFPSLTTGSTFISIYRPIDNYAPLLNMFHMIRYPNYPITIQTSVSGASPLFMSRQQFLCWEAAVEFRVLLEEVKDDYNCSF